MTYAGGRGLWPSACAAWGAGRACALLVSCPDPWCLGTRLAHYSIKYAPCTTASNAGTYEVVAMSGQPKPLWASELHPIGLHYYAGVVESAEDLLEKHKVATQCSFGTRKLYTGGTPG